MQVGIWTVLCVDSSARWLMGERGQGKKAGFIGMDRFDASAPAGKLLEKFDITTEAAVAKVKELMV